MADYNALRDLQEGLEPANASGTGEGKETSANIPQGSIGRSFEDISQIITQRLDHDLPTMYDPAGDTYIYIDPPAQHPERDNHFYKRYIQRYKQPLLMQSRKLLALGSPFFASAFLPGAQFRTLRRRLLVGKLPAQVKFAIDLTPPIEGEKAVYLTTELCCPAGVRQWSQASQRWGVSKALVGGEEEYAPQASRTRQESLQNKHLGGIDIDLCSNQALDSTDQALHLIPAEELPVEYCPLRHRAAIERVLLGINGQDPRLDSAVKVWTTCAVAKYFEVTHSPLTDYIVRWLRAYPNSYFVEVLPEVSLKIADGLQCHQLCRDSFAILVGEEALGNVRRCRDDAIPIIRSVHGRVKDDLPEEYQTRVEYASKALLDRIVHEFTALADARMSWVDELPEYRQLLTVDHPSIVSSGNLSSLKFHLKEYCRGAIYKTLCSDFTVMPDHEDDGIKRKDDWYPTTTTLLKHWKTLHPRERLFTRSFWKLLKHCCLFSGPRSFDLQYDHDIYREAPGSAKAVTCSVGGESFTDISKGFLQNLAENLGPGTVLRAELVERSNFNSPPDTIGNLPIRIREPDVNSNAAHEVQVPASSSYHDTTYALKGITLVELGSLLSAEVPSIELDLGMSTGFQAWRAERESTDRVDPPRHLHLPTSVADEKKAVTYSANRHVFELEDFFRQARAHIHRVCKIMLSCDTPLALLELGLTDTLICLRDSEWKYLPTWAGGDDDGSGGVFAGPIPIAEAGFSTAGPNLHTGTGSSEGSGRFEFINRQSDSSLDTSLKAHDGYLFPGLNSQRIYTASEGDIESYQGRTEGDTELHLESTSESSGTMPGSASTVTGESEYGMVSMYDDEDEGFAKSALDRDRQLQVKEDEAIAAALAASLNEDLDTRDISAQGDDDTITECGDSGPEDDDDAEMAMEQEDVDEDNMEQEDGYDDEDDMVIILPE